MPIPLVLPIDSPLTVLPEPRLIPLPAAFVMIGSVPPTAGSGVEFHIDESHDDPAKSGHEPSGNRETGFLIRTGVGYNFDLGGFTLGPAVFLDTLRETTSLVWGISIGKGF